MIYRGRVAPRGYLMVEAGLPAGVTIVTLEFDCGPVGFTATSFASLSLDPPLVSFDVTDTSSSFGAVRTAESLVIHLVG